MGPLIERHYRREIYPAYGLVAARIRYSDFQRRTSQTRRVLTHEILPSPLGASRDDGFIGTGIAGIYPMLIVILLFMVVAAVEGNRT